MIGDVPEGAPLRCKIGRHIGQKNGGLMVFQCERCGGDYWQTDPKYREAMDKVRTFEDAGEFDKAMDVAEEALGRSLR